MIGTCRLCQENRKLLKSHIIPEWAYESMYDEKHRIFQISSESERNKRDKFKGEYEHLLCQVCEDSTAKWDDYARAVIFSKPGEKTYGLMTSGIEGAIQVENVDYKIFKLFQLSLLWRASVSNREFFSKVELGPHENTIREMLIAEDPGNPETFGCIMLAIMKSPKELMHEMITQPEQFRTSSHRWYKFLFAGCGWMFVVSSHKKQFKYKNLFLSPSEPLIIPVYKARDAKWITGYLELIHDKLSGN